MNGAKKNAVTSHVNIAINGQNGRWTPADERGFLIPAIFFHRQGEYGKMSGS